MTSLSDCERILGKGLLSLPSKHGYRYGPQAERDLLELLFRSLTGHDEDRLSRLFANGYPRGSWKLAEAQGAREGAEYTEAARGKRCGHIFKMGEAAYRCVTCSIDETCVLCSRCFESSDHTGHQCQISLSSGNGGCCDCGDEEAWRLPLFCAIHTDSGNAKGKERAHSPLPQDWVAYIKLTVSRVLDYFCDVISCSPEQLRLPKTEDSIRQDERASRLRPGWYGEGDTAEEEPEFALVLWNDEKHTIEGVADQVTRACRERDRFGEERAQETNDIGRSVVKYSKDLARLLAVSTIIEQIKITVTVRSARDTFREQMCGTIVEWLADIAGCSVLEDNEILRNTICEELLGSWRKGSSAYNAGIGMKGIDDHQRDENVSTRTIFLAIPPQTVDDTVDEMDDPGPNEDDRDDGEEDEDYVEAQDDADDEDEDMELDIDRMHGDATGGGVMANTEVLPVIIEGFLTQHSETVRAHQQEGNTDQFPPEQPPSNEDVSMNGEGHGSHNTTHTPVPRTPWRSVKPPPARAPSHWLVRPTVPTMCEGIPPYEDVRQRTRLDWLILFDLRLWKRTRTDLRELYISTVVSVPQFKRIMGLRLSALYTALAELYMIADREPDHSIVNLSLQLLTTPSITEEIVHRGNFLANVMAILYTFLTTRQVGEPYEVNPNAAVAFDAGSVSNRRLYHFFLDLRYLLQSEYVQNRVRTEEQYLCQFLDLVKLSQGICPNVRAIGEHVEYETDTWISASILMREINRLCRQFSMSFCLSGPDDLKYLLRGIKTTAISAIVHSTGIERERFDQAEIKEYIRFKSLPCFDFEHEHPGRIVRHRVVDFVVERSSVSFHHALHYTLSWLLEFGRSISGDGMRHVLFDAATTANDEYIHDNSLTAEDLLLTMFDYPLRVCAWLAQMKAGMWVRNGLSLRHQMSQYRGVSSRDFAYYRDIFMLQTAFVICDPSRVLASITDRFGVADWMTRNYVPRAGYDEMQVLDVTEDFIHLLVILLTDRTSLAAADDSESIMRDNIRRDVAHILCFKPLSFSELSTRLSDKLLDSNLFQSTLDEVADFRPPEGLTDAGTFELKPDYLSLIDPYNAHYSKNQRDEAETIYKQWMAKKTGKKEMDIVYEPNLRPITAGIFSNLPFFSRTPLFVQIVHQCLDYIATSRERTPSVQPTRLETFLQVVLHLILIATLEDSTGENGDRSPSFISSALSRTREAQAGNLTVVGLLEKISTISEFSTCGPKIRHILKHFWNKQPTAYRSATAALKFPFDRVDTTAQSTDQDNSKEAKRKQALERQARVMAQFQQQQQNFLDSQGVTDWGESDSLSDSEADQEPSSTAKAWKYPSGTCILCQEETNDSRIYGTFALFQDSGILRQTDTRDADWVREVLRTPSCLDKSAENVRPFGVAGDNHYSVRRLDSAGGEVISEKIGLSKGFSAKNTLRGPVTTSCGHIMHYSCFEVYYLATQRRHAQQIARNHPERLLLKEFVCPLCKALGNAFLPIAWKSMEETYPGALRTSTPFERFIDTEIKFSLLQPSGYTLPSRKEAALWQPYTDFFADYLSSTLAQPLFSKADQFKAHSTLSAAQYLQPTRMSMPGVFPPGDDISASRALQAAHTGRNALPELLQIYKRLRETIRLSGVHSAFNHGPDALSTDELMHTDSLIRSFGFSIAAVEIAQRGVESGPGMTLLDKIPQLSLTHLRVMAETALTYAAVGSLHGPSGRSRPAKEFMEMHRQKVCQLFVGHPSLHEIGLLNDIRGVEPLFAMDTFVFLAECSLSFVPMFNISVRHLIQICYVAEIVKVVATFILWPLGLKEELARQGDVRWILNTNLSDGRYERTQHFFDSIVAELKKNSVGRAEGSSFPAESGYVKNGEDSATPDIIIALRQLISSYALTFLRKSAILAYIRYGVKFPNSGFTDMEVSELDRLTVALQLPTLDEIFISVNPYRVSGKPMDGLISGWIFHWNASRSGFRTEDHRLWPSLSHPGIFELIGLPKYFDSLIEEASRRRCPNSKRELSDPSICLFCGDIFCSQAVCCKNQKLGGCNQHALRCGKNIGLFINIRKCMVLYLHNRHGSWHFAPYLDEHGEVDPGLRRNRQLILNQKRYDRLLRDVWLSHGIPTAISRRLEAEINNGGWESI